MLAPVRNGATYAMLIHHAIVHVAVSKCNAKQSRNFNHILSYIATRS